MRVQAAGARAAEPPPIVHVSGAVVAPAAGAVVVDTGPLGAGVVELLWCLSSTDTAAVGKELIVQHRDLTNAFTLKVLAACHAPFALAYKVWRMVIADSERIRVVTGVVGAAGSTYKATLQVRPWP